MRLHTAINHAAGVPQVKIPQGYGRVHTIYQHMIPAMPHRWTCKPNQIAGIRQRGVRVDDDGTVYQAGGDWSAGNLKAFKASIDGWVRGELAKDFAGPVMLNVESLPLDDPAARPYLAELVRAIIDRGAGNQIGFYSAFRWALGQAVATSTAPAGIPSCSFVSLYVYTKLLVEGKPWTTAEANWSHWYQEHLGPVRAAKALGLPIFGMISIGSDVFGMVSSDHLRKVVTQAAAWGIDDLVVWGSMQTKDQATFMEQVLVGLREFVAEWAI